MEKELVMDHLYVKCREVKGVNIKPIKMAIDTRGI